MCRLTIRDLTGRRPNPRVGTEGRSGVVIRKKAALSLLLLLCIVPCVNSEQDKGLADQMSTSERLAKNAWWPTKPANSDDKYVGSAVCAECHADIARSQSESEMAQTLMPAKQAKVAEYAGKSVTVDGVTYNFLSAGDGIAFELKSATNSSPKSLGWAFGSGAISQVYLTQESNGYNESHFSYFEPIHGFDVTPAQPSLRDPARNEAPSPAVEQALGRTMATPAARRCFACHAANVPADGPIAGFIAGVTCEACHGPGANHSAAARAELPGHTALIFNPARLKPVDRVDFCGACHATSVDAQLGGTMGQPSVRFPAYRLQNSACWSNDKRIQCTACHDPHQPLLRDSAAYDQRCLACHQSSAGTKPDATHPGPACPAGSKDCAGCHMPKYDFPDVHHKFTDHQIRVVKPGEHVPA